LGLASASPLFGVGLFTAEMARASSGEWRLLVRWGLFWILGFSAAALILIWAILATFDSCLGRIRPGARAPRTERPR
jgi:hypothetical protein